MDIPTIGVGKTFLHVDGLTKGDVKALVAKSTEPSVALRGASGKVLGAALCGTAGVCNPVFVSIGHQLSLDTSLAIAQACCSYRIPEPIRQADLRSREVIRDWEQRKRVDTMLDSHRTFPVEL